MILLDTILIVLGLLRKLVVVWHLWRLDMRDEVILLVKEVAIVVIVSLLSFD